MSDLLKTMEVFEFGGCRYVARTGESFPVLLCDAVARGLVPLTADDMEAIRILDEQMYEADSPGADIFLSHAADHLIRGAGMSVRVQS